MILSIPRRSRRRPHRTAPLVDRHPKSRHPPSPCARVADRDRANSRLAYLRRHFSIRRGQHIDAPARTALIPLLVPAEQLASAYALNISWRQIATLAGPFIGGIVISVFGISVSYFIDAVSFSSVIVCLALMRARPSPAPEKKESPLESVRGGFNFIRNNAAILGLMSMDTCVQFFGATV